MIDSELHRESPILIAHADWSVAAAKRWLAIASREGPGRYHVFAPEPVGSPATLLERLSSRAEAHPVLLGFDCPIGVPRAYAARAGIERFMRALPTFGRGSRSAFFDVSKSAEEITVDRPFYPNRPGGKRQQHLLDGLGVNEMRTLLRRCDEATDYRRAASSLFWTLGPQQVGRAAISVWRDVLIPGLRAHTPALRCWPFDGDLEETLAPGVVVAAEVYPAESLLHVTSGSAPPRGFSKRRRADRATLAQTMFQFADSRGIALDSALQTQIRDGFGDRDDGEDRFDATIGVLGMLDVVVGRRTALPANIDADVRHIEGWILGQA